MSNKKSTEFYWDISDFEDMVSMSKFDDGVNLSLKYLKNKGVRVLEAGCGTGRVLKYLYKLGYENCYGIELNSKIVNEINKLYPELRIVDGDILKMPYSNSYFDVVLCYGVVEHFKDLGPVSPLKALNRVLKKGGYAVITIPSFNYVRRAIDFIDSMFKKIINSKLKANKPGKEFLYHVFPKYGSFFEYRLTPKEFENACLEAGYEIIESKPISHIDGMYHLFGQRFIKFEKWKFKYGNTVDIINKIMTLVPFLHNHMHACVLRKL